MIKKKKLRNRKTKGKNKINEIRQKVIKYKKPLER